MFQVSDVMIDKEEVSMAFNIPLHIPAASLRQTHRLSGMNRFAFQTKKISFQNRTCGRWSEKWQKSLLHKGFHAVSVPELYISYIPYPTAWKVIIGIL